MIPGNWVHPISFENVHLLFNQKNQKLVSLNPTAKILWQGLKSKIPVNEIVTILAKASQADINQIAADVEKIIYQWKTLEFFEGGGSKAGYLEDNKRGNSVFNEQHFTPADMSVPKGSYRILFQFADTRFELSTPHKEILKIILPYTDHLPIGGRVSGTINLVITKIQEQYLFFKGGKPADQCRVANGVLPMLHAGMLLSVYEKLDKHIGVHSAAVVKQGQYVLIPAKSGCGKSTLTAALIQSGFEFSADDIVFLLPKSGRALPIPSPIGLKKGSWSILEDFGYRPDDYPTHQRADGKKVKYIFPPENQFHRFDPARTAHVQCIVYPDFSQESSFCFQRLSPLESIGLLAEAGFSLPGTFGEKEIQQLMEWIKNIPAYRLCYNRLEDAVNAVQSVW